MEHLNHISSYIYIAVFVIGFGKRIYDEFKTARAKNQKKH